jgi:hypothetical protein
MSAAKSATPASISACIAVRSSSAFSLAISLGSTSFIAGNKKSAQW